MKITHEIRDALGIIHIKGDLAGEEVDRLQSLIQQCIDQDEVRDFIIDCSQMQSIDSRGLETLIWLQDRCTEQLGQMRLTGCTENVRTILEITRLAPRFDCHAEVEAATRSLR